MSLLGTFWAGWSWRGDIAAVTGTRTELKQSKGETKAVEQARSVEHSKNERLHEIGTQYEAARSENESLPSIVVAELRNGNYRLRDELASCETRNLSSAAATASQRDAGAVSREEIAGAAVRIARDSDDQLRACQAVVLADRK
ncbi:hypothetical protein [Stenotrophomonas humi]|uniref:hypothetical protein n=1 Tax=Stenotrophomonas humi TaxID=405444 RepID=UPI00128E9620|nr:hypothetical protein [Stenotrophomonas humi]